ncbi:MAG TPA: hypothetical protein VKQ71_08195 [Acidimicrobiales bacterium]|nr:hypothetical protein [Acidimicrobiales bacterium]
MRAIEARLSSTEGVVEVRRVEKPPPVAEVPVAKVDPQLDVWVEQQRLAAGLAEQVFAATSAAVDGLLEPLPANRYAEQAKKPNPIADVVRGVGVHPQLGESSGTQT